MILYILTQMVTFANSSATAMLRLIQVSLFLVVIGQFFQRIYYYELC